MVQMPALAALVKAAAVAAAVAAGEGALPRMRGEPPGCRGDTPTPPPTPLPPLRVCSKALPFAVAAAGEADAPRGDTTGPPSDPPFSEFSRRMAEGCRRNTRFTGDPAEGEEEE